MSILSVVGKKSWTQRLVVLLIYALLTVGGVTMFYPFALMVSGSMTNQADQSRQVLIQRYWHSKDAQFTKYLADKYHLVLRGDYVSLYYTGDNRSRLEVVYDDQAFIAHGVPEARAIEANPAAYKILADDWYAFLATLPPLQLHYMFETPVTDLNIQYLHDKYLRQARADYAQYHLNRGPLERAALKELVDAHDIGYQYIYTVQPIKEPHLVPDWFPDMTDRRLLDWLDFKREILVKQHPADVQPIMGRQYWFDYLTQKYGNASGFNQAFAEFKPAYTQLYDIPFPPTAGKVTPLLRTVWDQFVKDGWPARLTTISHPQRYHAAWQSFLVANTSTDPAVYQTMLGIMPGDALSRNFPTTPPSAGTKLLRVMWVKFERAQVATGDKILDMPEKRYGAFLQAKYGSPAKLPSAYGKVASLVCLEPPIRQVDYYEWYANRGAIFRGFLFNNYKTIFAFITTKGRALQNTVVLVLLTLLVSLTVNPIAAYALSRYRLKQTQQILLFLIATMAFPASISSIPAFLLMRDLHLLNTYWALLLPGLANGFSIFILKGFFDSLPQELFEAASLDGAGEYVMFTQVCMPLVTPILAVTALGAFNAAYLGWDWAMLVCQKQEMWTIMVWLMQLQLGWYTPASTIMASLVVASLPMLLMFIFAQNIIMR
ncbi:MAG TPA: carbohydrate ABC transporter permease, partial [Armatimonadota bacterium]